MCSFALFDSMDQAKAVQLYILKTNAIPPIAVTASERENYNSAMGGCVRQLKRVDASGMRRLHALYRVEILGEGQSPIDFTGNAQTLDVAVQCRAIGQSKHLTITALQNGTLLEVSGLIVVGRSTTVGHV